MHGLTMKKNSDYFWSSKTYIYDQLRWQFGPIFYVTVSQVTRKRSRIATNGRGRIRLLYKCSVCLTFLYVKQIITFCPASVSMLHGS